MIDRMKVGRRYHMKVIEKLMRPIDIESDVTFDR
jgi:ribosomal 50S subunit-associated protein YjgA (DUF615 family)